jgi:CMP-2-keto-3-deoxyoctulosonic acid synthetase
MKIRVAAMPSTTGSIAVDTPEDLEKVRALFGAAPH